MTPLERLTEMLSEGLDREIVTIRGYDGLEDLTELPGTLPLCAVQVDIRGCFNLEQLRVRGLIKLRGLVIQGNDRMQHFPDGFPETLEELCLLEMRSLLDLPPIRQTRIHTLDLSDCDKVVVVPAFPPSMRSAVLARCLSVKRIEGLNEGLATLVLDRCIALEEIVGPYPRSLKYLVMLSCDPRIVPRPDQLPLGCQCVNSEGTIFKGTRVPAASETD